MSEKLAEAILDFANAVEAACVNLKRYVGEQHGVGIKEETFVNLLGWEESKGNRIGTFEFTTKKANNNSDAFNRAFNILKANGATISKRFHDKGFQHSYWLFDSKPETIYRQVLKSK